MDIHSINLVNSDKSNYNWIKNILTIGIDNLITKWINCFPFRLVMIRSSYCYTCDTFIKEVWTETTDDYDGDYSRCGWVYCKKCAKLKEYSKYYYEKNQKHLMYRQTNSLRGKIFKFWRISSNKSIPPYIEKNSEIIKGAGNTLNIVGKRITVPISWSYGGEEYNKNIYLSNLLYFNRDLFKYRFENLGITNLNKTWKDLLNSEYVLVNRWCELIVLLIKKNIPNGIIRNICNMWGGFI